jgi:TolB-like protein
MTLAVGTRLGPYEILAPIGAGGMGEVYRARDARLGRDVALKVLPPELAVDQDRLRRFEREARAASALNHPNVVTIHDVGTERGTPWLAMELVDGRSLRALLSGGALPLPTLVSIAAQVAEALARAHEAGIVHRDLKPENVMVTDDGLVKVLDFGLAKAVPAGEVGSLSATLDVETSAGVILGTVGYMSPEQAAGRAADFRSDQFSLGAILYEMAAGRRAFRRETAVETLSAIVRDEPTPLAELRPDVPEPLRWIVERCLAKEPHERYASTRDLARDLARLRDGSASMARATAPGVQPKASRRLRLVLGIAILLALAGGGTLWRLRTRAGPAAAGKASLAVLPFQNFGGDARDDYFVDGMTESLITDLAKVEGLLVIARNSVFVYKGKPVDVRRVGKELDVKYVLEGSVQRAGDTVRVNAQLVDAASGFHVWADKYDRPVTQLLRMEDEISSRIASALRLALRPAPAAPAPTASAANAAAYDQYLRGLFYARQDSWQQKDESLPYLEKAVELDPSLAIAHGELAQQYARKSFTRDPDRTWAQKAFVEIEKSLALDPRLTLAYTARATLTWTLHTGFDHEKSAADIKKALAIDPNDVTAHDQLGSLYMHVGLLDEALKEYGISRRLNPQQSSALYRIARIHFYLGRYEEALAEYEAHFPKDFQKPLVLAHLGRVDEAMKEGASADVNISRGETDPDPASTRAVVFALARRPEEAEKEITATFPGAGSSHFHHAAYNVATAYALLGKKAQALDWLERVAREGMPCTPLFEKDPFLDSLRSDPAFQAFLVRTRATTERLRKVL